MSFKYARVISAILSYPVIGMAEMIFLCYVNGVDLITSFLGVLLHSFGPIIAPIIYGKTVRKGDFFVSKRPHRPLLFIPGMLSYIIALHLFYSLDFREIASLEFVSISISIILALITLAWKISIHMASIAIPIIFFPLLGYVEVLAFSPLLFIVGWARLKVKAHNLAQVLGGALVGFIPTFLILLFLKSIGYVRLIV